MAVRDSHYFKHYFSSIFLKLFYDCSMQLKITAEPEPKPFDFIQNVTRMFVLIIELGYAL